VAAQQIDRNEDIRINGELTAQGARATAARDAVSALSDLLAAQNAFLAQWAAYEALRRGLDLDLGTMQLDGEGIWIDPGSIGEEYGQYDPWVWRTGGAECPLPQAREIMPAELLPSHRPHTEALPLPGEAHPDHASPPSLEPLEIGIVPDGPAPQAPPEGPAIPQLEGLPRIEGLPRRSLLPDPPLP
jgi:hypothetical protein